MKLFVRLKSKMERCIHFQQTTIVNTKNIKSVNRNIVAAINDNKYNDVQQVNKFINNSMNTIQIKDYRTGTFEINEYS